MMPFSFISGLGGVAVSLSVVLVYLLAGFFVYFVIYEAVFRGVRRALLEAWRETRQHGGTPPVPPQ